MSSDEDPFDFPCSYTFRAYSAEINEGKDLPPLIPRWARQPEPLDIETLKQALRQVLAERQAFQKVVTKERLRLLEESKAAQHTTAGKPVPDKAGEGKHQKPIYEVADGIDSLL